MAKENNLPCSVNRKVDMISYKKIFLSVRKDALQGSDNAFRVDSAGSLCDPRTARAKKHYSFPC